MATVIEKETKEKQEQQNVITLEDAIQRSGISQICTYSDCQTQPGDSCGKRRCGRPFAGE